MAFEYLLFISFATQAFGTLRAKCELATKAVDYLQMFREWLNYLKQLDEKKLTLSRKMEALKSLEEDLNEMLKEEESGSRKKRKREVQVWMENVKRARMDVETVAKEISKKKNIFLKPLLEKNLDACLKEVNELSERGKFPEGLFLDIALTSKQPLLTRELVGRSGYVDQILDWLNDSGVLRIGVYGVEGVGKTALLTHVQSQLSQGDNTDFDHVYWVGLEPKERSSVVKLQDSIAKQVRLSLSDEGESRIRAAELHGFLAKRGKCVIIIDDLCKKVSIEEVGIQDCKLVFSASSLSDCRKISCDNILEIMPLSDIEAMTLLETKLSCADDIGPEFKEILEHVIRECKGLPSRIVKLAERLRGVDDINEWRDLLNEVTQNKIRFLD